MLPSEVDIRQIDTEFGPLRKWDRRKLLHKTNILSSKIEEVTQKQEQLAEVIYGPQFIEERGFGHIPETARPFYKFDENLGLPILRDGTENNYPHPTNHDLDIPSDFTSQTVNEWKRKKSVTKSVRIS